MITVTIMSILLAFALPSFQRLLQQARIDSEATNLQSFLMAARGEAIKRGQTVWISNGNAGWAGALTAFVDINGNATQDSTEPTVGSLAALSEIVLKPVDKLLRGVGYGANGGLVGASGPPPNGSLGLQVPKLIGFPDYYVGYVSFGVGGRTTLPRFDVPKASYTDTNE